MRWIKNRDNFKNRRIYTTTPESKEIYLAPRIIRLVLILAVLAILVWWLFYSSYFQIKNIVIEGSLNPEVAEEIDNLKGKNIFTMFLGNSEKELSKKQTSIDSIKIHRGIPDTLKVKVNVRQPLIAWKSQDKIYLIDKNGIIFERGEGNVVLEDLQKIPTVIDSQNIPIELGNQILSKEFLEFSKKIFADFYLKTGANITEMKIGETSFQLELQSDQGWRALFDTTRSPDTQLDVLKKILDQYRADIHEYMDLRVEGRVYYK